MLSRLVTILTGGSPIHTNDIVARALEGGQRLVEIEEVYVDGSSTLFRLSTDGEDDDDEPRQRDQRQASQSRSKRNKSKRNKSNGGGQQHPPQQPKRDDVRPNSFTAAR